MAQRNRLFILISANYASSTPNDIYGCTYELACNYNEEANIDDGSCVFPELIMTVMAIV